MYFKTKTRVKIFIIGEIITILLSMIVATQIFAHQTRYATALGHPFVKQFYLPWKIFEWHKWAPYAPKSYELARTMGLLTFLVLFFLVVIIFRMTKHKTTHGSADWATSHDIDEMGLYETDGVFLGEAFGKTLIHSDKPHVHMCAPTRSGKGVGVVIPTCCTHTGSLFVNDIKGENWDLTAGYREKKFNNTVLRLEFTGDPEKNNCSFNPLAEIDVGTPQEITQVDALCIEMIGVGEGQSKHWNSAGISLLRTIILHVLYTSANPCFADVVQFITSTLPMSEKFYILKSTNHVLDNDSDKNKLNNTLTFAKIKTIPKAKDDPETWTKLPPENKNARKLDNADKFFQNLYNETSIINPYTHPVVARMAADFGEKNANEAASILSVVVTALGMFNNPNIIKNTSKSTFRVKDLQAGEKPTSLYLITEPGALDLTAPLMRVLITQILNGLMKAENVSSYDGKNKKHKLLMLIDEFPAIGKMEMYERALAYTAGYDIKTLMISQSINQLNKIYGKDNAIMASSEVQIYYTPNDIETADMISKRLGKKTINYTTTSNESYSMKMGNMTQNLIGRELLTPDEVMVYSQDQNIIFMRGQKPIKGRKVKYYEDTRFKDCMKTRPKVEIEREKQREKVG